MDRLQNQYIDNPPERWLDNKDIEKLNKLRYGEQNGVVGDAANVYGGI